MADDFENAVVISFDQGMHSKETRDRAEAYLSQLKANPEYNWMFYISRFHSAARVEVKFWCLTVLCQRYPTMPDGDRASLRGAVLEWLSGPAVQTPLQEVYLRNKFAALYAIFIKQDYPASFPGAFTDLLARLQNGAPVIDITLRVLDAVDTDLISKDFALARSDNDTKRAVEVKDAMRLDCIAQFVEVWYQLLSGYRSGQLAEPILARDCLEVVTKYIVWIDVGFIANERFVTLFYQFLSDPYTRKESICCLAALVDKGMPKTAKLDLVKSLQLGQVLQAVQGEDFEEDEELCAEVAALVNIAGIQLIDGWLTLPSPANDEALAGALQLMPQLHRFLSHRDNEVAEEVFDFVGTYIDSLKKAFNDALPEVHAVHLRALLQSLLTKAEYPDDYNFEEEETFEAEFIEFRKVLMKYFKKIQLIAPDLTAQFLTEAVHGVLGRLMAPPQGLPFPTVEITMHALYLAGEAASMQGVAFEWIQELTAKVLESDLSAYPHRCVVMIYHELVDRYIHVVHARPQYVVPVVQALLDARGLRHPHPQVRGRTAYLFKKMAKKLREQAILYQHFDTVMGNLSTLLEVQPPGSPSNSTIVMEDQLQLMEVAGQLIISDFVDVAKQHEYLAALVTPLLEQIHAAARNPHLTTEPLLKSHLCNLMCSLGHISKGCPRNAPPAVDVFSKVLDSLSTVIAQLPAEQEIFNQVMFFMHRMVDSLGKLTLPKLLGILLPLLPRVNNSLDSLGRYMLFVNQVNMKFRKDAIPITQALFLPLVQGIQGMIKTQAEAPTGVTVETEMQRESNDLRRIYYDFIHCILGHETQDVLVMPEHAHLLEGILQGLLEGALTQAPENQKICILCLKCVVELWGTTEPFTTIVYEKIMPATFQIIFAPTFNIEAGESRLIIASLAGLQVAITKSLGAAASNVLAEKVLPAIGIPPQNAREVASSLTSLNDLELRKYMKGLVQQMKAART